MRSLLLICVGIILSLSAHPRSYQDQDPDREAFIKSQKIAFFTQKVGLTPEESQNFWPIYDNFWSKKNAIILERRAAINYCVENMSSMSPSEIEAYGDKYVELQKTETELLENFNTQIKTVLSPDKVVKLYQADYEFKSFLLQRLNNREKKD